MKKMKKLICVVMTIAILMLCLVGCGSEKADEDVLRVGIDLKYYPFMYLDDDGNPAGFEVDIAYAFGEYVGMEVEIVNTDFSMLIPALDTGDVDILISDMSAQPERELKADFSDPYRYSRSLALVNKDFAIANNITEDMTEEEFFTIDGMVFAGLAGSIAVTIPASYGAEVVEYTEIASALMEVSRGTADAIVGASTIYGDHVANADTTIIYEGITESTASCFAVKKGDEELLQLANEFIASMYADGGFYDQAGTKYDDAIGEFMQNDEVGLDFIIYPAGKE
ncbi:MAG: transporter substrate-binding domain-containing protein [Bacillota bacterium]